MVRQLVLKIERVVMACPAVPAALAVNLFYRNRVPIRLLQSIRLSFGGCCLVLFRCVKPLGFDLFSFSSEICLCSE